MADTDTIDLAIIGAGITSLCLARGLLQNPHINVRIYEARPKLAEDGTGVGIACNGRNALSLIDSDLRNCLDSAGAVTMVPDLRFILATGDGQSTHIKSLSWDPP